MCERRKSEKMRSDITRINLYCAKNTKNLITVIYTGIANKNYNKTISKYFSTTFFKQKKNIVIARRGGTFSNEILYFLFLRTTTTKYFILI